MAALASALAWLRPRMNGPGNRNRGRKKEKRVAGEELLLDGEDGGSRREKCRVAQAVLYTAPFGLPPFFYLPLCLSRRLDLAGLDSVRSPLRSIGDRGGEGCWENIGTEAPTDISVLLRNLPLGNGHRRKKRLGKELGIEMNRH